MNRFGEMTREQKLEIFTAWVDGSRIEFYDDAEWTPVDNPSWVKSNIYRIKPVVRMPSINWAQVSHEFKYLAVDTWQTATLYVKEPKWNYCKYWLEGAGRRVDAHIFTSFDIGEGYEFKNSLIKRPE